MYMYMHVWCKARQYTCTYTYVYNGILVQLVILFLNWYTCIKLA